MMAMLGDKPTKKPWAIVTEIPAENKCTGAAGVLCGKKNTCVICAAKRDDSTWGDAVRASPDLVRGLESLRDPMNGGWAAMYPGENGRSTENLRDFVRSTIQAMCTSVPLRDKLSTCGAVILDKEDLIAAATMKRLGSTFVQGQD